MDWTPLKKLLPRLEREFDTLGPRELEELGTTAFRELYRNWITQGSADLGGLSSDDTWALNLAEPFLVALVRGLVWTFDGKAWDDEERRALCEFRSGLELLARAAPAETQERLCEEIRELDARIEEKFLDPLPAALRQARLEAAPAGHDWWAAVGR